jgi:hypothetical protein
MSEFNPKSRPDRPNRPTPSGHTPTADAVLREMAYVLHLTERVKRDIVSNRPPRPTPGRN